MIGDLSPILSLRPIRTSALPPTPPPLPSPGQASSFVASVRGLKISENQSPRPQDRFFYTFNYFAEVNQHLNQKLEASVSGLRVYREVLGFEKTFNEGNGSVRPPRADQHCLGQLDEHRRLRQAGRHRAPPWAT